MYLKKKKNFSSKKEVNLLVRCFFLWDLAPVKFYNAAVRCSLKSFREYVVWCKNYRVIKDLPKLVASIYLVSLNTFSRIFEKFSSQKRPWNWKDFFVCQGCNSPVKNNGLPFPSPYDLVVAAKMRREYFKDEKKQMHGPSNEYFHVFHKNQFTFPFHFVQRPMMTFQMHSVQLHCDAFKSLRTWKFKKFIYNVWVCQYHCFTWTYQPMT